MTDIPVPPASTYDPSPELVSSMGLTEYLNEGEIVRWIGRPTGLGGVLANAGVIVKLAYSLPFVLPLEIMRRGHPFIDMVWIQFIVLPVALVFVWIGWRNSKLIAFFLTTEKFGFFRIGNSRATLGQWDNSFGAAPLKLGDRIVAYPLKYVGTVKFRIGIGNIGDLTFYNFMFDRGELDLNNRTIVPVDVLYKKQYPLRFRRSFSLPFTGPAMARWNRFFGIVGIRKLLSVFESCCRSANEK